MKMKQFCIGIFLLGMALLMPTQLLAQKAGGQIKRPTSTNTKPAAPAKPTVALTPLEKKVVGKHLFGEWWLVMDESGRGYSTLTITKQADGRLRCKGTQRSTKQNKKDYVVMDGYIEIINENKLVFDGTIKCNFDEDKGSYGGEKKGDEIFTGRFFFHCHSGRTYWRQYDEDEETKKQYSHYGGCYLDIFKKIMR